MGGYPGTMPEYLDPYCDPELDLGPWRRRWPDCPKAQTVRRVRQRAELTQEQAADLVYCRVRRWQSWEYSEAPMHPAFWELFCRKLAELQAANSVKSPEETG
jgi:hypothetical protein